MRQAAWTKLKQVLCITDYLYAHELQVDVTPADAAIPGILSGSAHSLRKKQQPDSNLH